MQCFLRSAVWVVVGALNLCGSPPPAAAQLRSFAAIKSIELDPPLPGTEKACRELAESLKVCPRFQPDWDPCRDFHPPPPAHCTLRADLPKPRVLGLECHDPAGRYIGTLRAKRINELSTRLCEYSYRSEATPETLPLTEYRYIFVRLAEARRGFAASDPWVADYVAQLLRAEGAWQVLTSRDMLPAGEADRLLECRVSGASHSSFAEGVAHGGVSRLTLVDSAQNIVRGITGQSDWTGVRGSLRHAVDNLMNELRLDEEVHKPLPPGTREPK